MDPIRYTTVSSEDELMQILELQKANLPEMLTDKELQDEGFVTVVHTLELLSSMNERCPHILAKSGDEVIGYALCMHPDFRKEIDILKPMFQEIDKVISPEAPYLIMGQICIDKPYRRKGIFRGLYQKMLESTQKEFSKIITEVDGRNQRSLTAHYAVGFQDLSQYQSNGRDWYLITLQ
ncbi:GNAT family N-acetyltransferase [Flavobacteriaceae bacterium D16]|nr:GNAT family N-acetyltransferase [Flavobacteriaceae bacterium D16]